MRADESEVFAGKMLQILADPEFGTTNIGDERSFFDGRRDFFEEGSDARNRGAAND